MVFNYKDTSKEHFDSHIDRIIDIIKSIDLDKVTILTGNNGLGKSMIRKQLYFKMKKSDVKIASVSMQLRTDLHEGGINAFYHDLPWKSTSNSTISLLSSLISSILKNDDKNEYIVIDELEIGMSDEIILGVVNVLNKLMPQILEHSRGVLVITHSKEVVENLKHNTFINIEGMTESEWANRDIIPIDIDEFTEWCNKLYCEFAERSKK